MRPLVLFSAAGTALTTSYATTGQEDVLRVGALSSWPFVASVTRDGAGNTVRLKLQGTVDQPDPLLLYAGNVVSGVRSGLRLFAASRSTLRLAFAGNSIVHSVAGSDVAITFPRGTRLGALAAYIAANLSAVLPTAAVFGDALAELGETLRQAEEVPAEPRWADLMTLRQDTAADQAEHTIDAGAGASTNVAFIARNIAGFQALRIVGRASAAPATADRLHVVTGVV